MTSTITEPETAIPEGKKKSALSRSAKLELFAIPVIVVVGVAAFVFWRSTTKLDEVEESILGWPALLLALRQHVELTVVSAVLVVLIAVTLGILLTRGPLRRASTFVVALANVGQAAPSVGLIVLLYMWLGNTSFIGAIGGSFAVAVIALTLYGILPVLQNTIVGIQGVNQSLVEAARGMGMSPLSVLFRIELRLAVPVIMSGVRTALVLLVGTATLATFVGAGGMGSIINGGVTLDRMRPVVWGAILVALLALLIEWIGRLLELAVRPKGL